MRYLCKSLIEPESSIVTTEKVDLRLLAVDDTGHCRYTKLHILRCSTYIIHIQMIRCLKCWPQSTPSPVSISLSDTYIHKKPFSLLLFLIPL